MKKRIMSLLIIAAMLLSVFPVVYANGEMSFTVSVDKQQAMPGDEVTFSVNIAGAEEQAKMQLTLNYDKDKLEYKGNRIDDTIKKNSFVSNIISSEPGKIGFAAVMKEGREFSGDGELFSVTFAVKDGAYGGLSDYSLSNIKFGKADEDPVVHDEWFDREGSDSLEIIAGERTYIAHITADKDTVSAGDELRLSINLDEPELDGFQFDVKFDENLFAFSDCVFPEYIEENAGMVSPASGVEGGIVRVLAMGDYEISDSVAEITLVAKAGIPAGKTEIGLEKVEMQTKDGRKLKESVGEKISIQVNGEEIASTAVLLTADKHNVAVGEDFTVKVSATALSNFRGMQFDLQFDENVFELAGEVEMLGGTEDAYVASCDGNSFILAYSENDAVSGEAEFFAIPLRAKANVSGEYVIRLDKFKSDPQTISSPEAVKIAVSVEALGNIDVSANTDRAAAGEIIVYSFDIRDAQNVNGIQFDVDYDGTVLEYIGFEDGIVSEGFMNLDEKPIKVVMPFGLSGSAYYGSDRLFTLKFRVREGTSVGNAAIEVKNIKSDASLVLGEIPTVSIYDASVSAIVTALPGTDFAAKGEEVIFDINISSNSEIGGMQFVFDYDAASLEYIAHDTQRFDEIYGTFANSINFNNEEGYLEVLFSFADKKMIDDLFGTFAFKVKESASKGKVNYAINNAKVVDDGNVEAVLGGELRVIDRRTTIAVTADPQRISHGDTVNAEIVLKNLDEAAGMQLAVEFDENVFDLVEFQPADFLDESSYNIEEGKRVSLLTWFDEPRSDDALSFGTLILQAKESYENGETVIGITEAKYAADNAEVSHARIPVEIEEAAVYINTSADKAARVIALIDAIGEVTLGSGDAIATAEAAYAELTAEQKTLVTNNAELTAARVTYDKLVDDRAKADAVIALIDAIGEVTLGSGDAIATAETAYAALTAEQKELVTNYAVLTTARVTYDKLVDDRAKADAVIALIDAIGEVTLGSGDAIATAETAYAALAAEQKTLVTNYAELTAARSAYDKLVNDRAKADAVIDLINAIGIVTLASENAIVTAETAYRVLTEEQKDLVSNHGVLENARIRYNDLLNDRSKADAVIALIDAIGVVTLNSEDAIASAETAYAALTEEQKTLVTNYAELTTARSAYDKLVDDRAKADAVIALVDAIGEVTLDSGDAIATAEAAYETLTEEQKAIVGAKYDDLTTARDAYDKLVKINNVSELIAAIGDVTIDSIETIEAAEQAYDELDEELQERVENYELLTAAREEYDAQKAAVDAVIAAIDAIEEPITKYSKDAIEAAEAAYEALTEAQQAHVTNIESLTQKRSAYDAIKTVTFDADGGTPVPEAQYINEGDTVTKPNNPSKSGYTFVDWYSDSDLKTVWDFANGTVSEDITLYAKWNKNSTGGGGGGGGGGVKSSGTSFVITTPTNPTPDKTDENNSNDTFGDIQNHWAKDSIEGLHKAGIVSGDETGAFNPDRTVTRAEFTTMIYNLLKLEAEGTSPFADVSEGDWYFTAVSSVAKTDIIVGYDGNFRPNDNISRQEMAVVISKVYDYIGLEDKGEASIDGFTDSRDIAEWSAPFVAKMVAADVINGYDDGTFRPLRDTSRAHAAAVIYRVFNLK